MQESLETLKITKLYQNNKNYTFIFNIMAEMVEKHQSVREDKKHWEPFSLSYS